MYCDSNEILSFFQRMENQQIKYAVLRDVEQCIPNKIDESKDIDLVIYPHHKAEFHKFMKAEGFKKERHPWDFGNNFVFLYAMDKFEFYAKEGMRIDVCYQLACRSTDHGEWVPIDQVIQKSAWENRKRNERYSYYQLSSEDEFVHLITRCIFDKKVFKEEYRNRLHFLYQQIDKEDVRMKLSMVVFRYADSLLNQIENGEYDKICDNYLRFTEY